MSHRRPRRRRRVAVVVAHAVAGVLVVTALPSCDTGNTTVASPITFSIPSLVIPTPPSTAFDPGSAIPVNPAPPASLALPPDPLLFVTTTTAPPPPLPPTCEDLLAVTQMFTGPAGNTGGEEYDASNGHDYARCFGTVLPSGDAAAGGRSAIFEIWTYPAGTYPDGLATSGSPYTDPSAFSADAAFDAGVTVTEATLFSANSTSTARRAARFPCGSYECWLYLEEGTLYPPDVDTSTLDSHIAGIARALRGPAGDPTPAPTTLPDLPRPNCDLLTAPVDAILAIFKVAPLGRTDGQFPDDAAHSYVGCYGSLYINPPSSTDPTPSSRNVAYQLFVFTSGSEPDFLRLTPTEQPTPELGDGVTSDGGSLTVVRAEQVPANDEGITLMHNSTYDFNFYRLGGGGEPYDLRTTDARRTVRFSCGRFECYLALAETAYAPPDPDVTLIDAQLKIFIAATRASLQTFPG